MPIARALFTALALPAVLLSLSCNSSSPIEPDPVPTCSYQATAPSDALPPEGGQLTITITAQAACGWTVRSSSEWITVPANPAGSGNGTVVITVAPNGASTVREGTLTVETQTVRISQRGRTTTPCTFEVTTPSQRFGPEGGTGRASIATAEGCTWTANATEGWLTLDRSSGTGSAEVTYTVAPFTGTTERSASIRVNDRSVTIRQDPVRPDCQFAVEPTQFDMHWHAQPNVEVRLTTAVGCRWAVRSTAAWLTVEGSSDREGSGILRFSTANFLEDATRRAALEFRWDTATAGQNVWVDQGGCRYGMDLTPRTYGPAGDPDEMLNVVMQPVSPSCAQPCPWTATTDVPWIHITSSMPRAGDDVFRYSVDANATGATRQGRIQVAYLVLVITQTP